MPLVSLATLKSDPELFTAAFNFCKKEFSTENILFYYAKGDPKEIYEKFIGPDAEAQVNLPSQLAEPMHKLAGDAGKNPDAWKDPAWTKLLEDSRESIKYMWDKDTRRRFLESNEYKAVSAKVTANAAKAAVQQGGTTLKAAAVAVSGQKQEVPAAVPEVAAQPPSLKTAEKAAKLLGISDTKTLLKAMTKSFEGDQVTSEKLLNQLSKQEGVDVKKAIQTAKLDQALKLALMRAMKLRPPA